MKRVLQLAGAYWEQVQASRAAASSALQVRNTVQPPPPPPVPPQESTETKRDAEAAAMMNAATPARPSKKQILAGVLAMRKQLQQEIAARKAAGTVAGPATLDIKKDLSSSPENTSATTAAAVAALAKKTAAAALKKKTMEEMLGTLEKRMKQLEADPRIEAELDRQGRAEAKQRVKEKVMKQFMQKKT